MSGSGQQRRDETTDQRRRATARNRALAEIAEAHRDEYEAAYRRHRAALGLPDVDARAHRMGRARHGRPPIHDDERTA